MPKGVNMGKKEVFFSLQTRLECSFALKTLKALKVGSQCPALVSETRNFIFFLFSGQDRKDHVRTILRQATASSQLETT